jgi:hypothetical protein
MRLAVMQPYVFPYIGYFQLIQAVDTFVFYDDVNYIKGGWINRNRILLNGKVHFLTIACSKASPNRLINEVEIDNSKLQLQKLSRTLELTYKKAPCFNQVFPLINNILQTPVNNIAVLAEQSVKRIAEYLNINIKFKTSSVDFAETKGLDKADRLIEICKKTNSNHYINPIGGTTLYNKAYFEKHDIQLNFINSMPIQYNQFNNEFIPWLSIIDVLMFNQAENIYDYLSQYQLV